MSKNMVERVARAMARRRQERHDLAPPWWSEDGPQPADTIMLWEDEKEVFRDDARAAIEAIRPTPAEMEDIRRAVKASAICNPAADVSTLANVALDKFFEIALKS